MLESSPVFHLGGLSEREQTIGLLERGTVVTRYQLGTVSEDSSTRAYFSHNLHEST